MGIVYRQLNFASRDREHVSRMWYVLLHDIYYGFNGPALKVFNVNEGHRTWARQEQLVREKGVYNSITNPDGAALPSANAPHIWSGRPDHAIDLDGVDAVIDAARRRGVHLLKSVSTEAWHVIPVLDELERYYNRNKARVLGIGHRELHPGMTGEDVRYAQRLLKSKGFLRKTWKTSTHYRAGMHKAVNAFKRYHHLPADGAVGPRVWALLKKG